ncbi:MAG: flagellar filament capping protein FliD [Allosphingosinicella sp.]|uniref:flagellar filament capping protein FliD n=1 Tax=Allosphingosinicella sp. TaxID=2823234 RepID=UPI003946BAD6
MTSSIGYSLGIGSGIDIKALVDGLAAAQKGPREAQIAKREEANAARLSALAEVGGAIDFFASALGALVSGGTLFSQPSVSDPSLFSASALPGARIGALSAQVEVVQLAQAQTLHSETLAGRLAPVGQGGLVLTVGGRTHEIAIDAGNDSLEGLARAINDARSGVVASIVTDAAGARLVLKGQTGEAAAFTLSVADGSDAGLERFAFGPDTSGGMAAAQTARDAVVRLDGVEVRRASNSFSDLIPGVRIDLKRAAPGAVVSVGVSRPTAAIEQGVADFVEAFNELARMLASATSSGLGGGMAGPLRGDLGIKDMQRQLAQLTSTVLASDGDGPRTLAEIGVRTNRDGTLSLDRAMLKTRLAADPEGVEALFNPSQRSSSPFVTIGSAMGRAKPGVYTVTDLVPAADGSPASGRIDGVAMVASGRSLIAPAGSKALGLVISVERAVDSATITIDPGLGGALQAIRDALRGRGGPLETANDRVRAEARDIAKARDAMELRAETYYNQLVKQFTSMERQVSAFKATQSYLDQQIKIWTASRD